MPAPNFAWRTYEVRVPTDSPLRALTATPSPFALMHAAPGTMSVRLPDLRAWSSPRDKAEILLESAAEIEHALMVQYLYAAYSLKSTDEVIDPAQQAALDDFAWPAVLFGIAREEMGHLLTVQNMLLLLGLPPNFEREDFPPRKEFYPFSLHLERLSQKSLAKYVVAEAPFDATDIDDITQLAQESTGAVVNHVGVLDGLLGLVFATEEQVQEGGSGSTAWDEMVRDLSQAAYQQAPADTWHLPDSAFHPLSAAQQADPADWQVSGLRVHRMADRAAARSAIRDIGEQGEGPTNEGVQSHFDRFRGMYRGQEGIPAFPAAGEWAPHARRPDGPAGGRRHHRATHEALGRAGRHTLCAAAWLYRALPADLRRRQGYSHRLDIRRDALAPWVYGAQAHHLGRGGAGGVAAAPFTLPALLHLPGAETARWGVHKQRTEEAMAQVEEMQAADAADQADPYLSDLLASDRARLAFIAGRTAALAVTTSFARDILPLFRPIDIEHMRDSRDGPEPVRHRPGGGSSHPGARAGSQRAHNAPRTRPAVDEGPDRPLREVDRGRISCLVHRKRVAAGAPMLDTAQRLHPLHRTTR